MNKKSKKLNLLATSFILFGSLALVSCGDDKGTTSEYVAVDDTFTRELTDLKDNDTVIIYNSTTYFSGHLRRENSDGEYEYANLKSEALLKAGETVQTVFYGLPRSYNQYGIKITTPTGTDVTDQFEINNEGEIKIPNVTTKTEYIIYFYGVSSNNTVRDSINLTVVPESEFASNESIDGDINYALEGDNERAAMAGALEQYLYNNGLAPISYMEDSGYSLYSSRLHTPFLNVNGTNDDDNYVPGFGYGVMQYGYIEGNQVMDGVNIVEDNPEYVNYYHSAFTGNASNFNYLNSNNNDASTLYGYMSSSYFDQLVNEDVTGWEYVGSLARKFEAVNPDETGASDTWTVSLKVGGETADEDKGVLPGINFRTGRNSRFKATYDNRAITIDDYITPIKLLATGAVRWYRGTEQAGEDTANRQIVGFAEYYNSTGRLTEVETNDEFLSKVPGIQVNRENNSITFKFGGKVTPDYAEYQLNSVWANPICEDFLRELGGGNVLRGTKVYGTSTTIDNQTLRPDQTMLSVGPYFLDEYTAGEGGETGRIIYSKNKDWPITKDAHGRDLYRLEGIILKIDTSLLTSNTAQILAFENGQYDASNIPNDEYWAKYENSELRHYSQGSTNSQYHINTWDQLYWEERFEDGGELPDWRVKPILSNNNFYKGLQVGLDRIGISNTYHYQPDIDISTPIDMVSPRSGVSFNDLDYHKDAINNVFGGLLNEDTKTLNFWRSNAAEFFAVAIEEELAAGHYTLGTGANPTVVTFEIARTDSTYETDLFNALTQDWEEAFATAVETYRQNGQAVWMDGRSPRIRLEITSDTFGSSSATLQDDMLTNGVQAGKYDGETTYVISGNNYDVLNKLNIYKSDNSSGFTLNFGGDTTIPSADIYYDGKYWSFDALWDAANGNGIRLTDTGKVIELD